MDKGQLETLLTTLDWWTGLFTLLVVIGVGGEFVLHIWSSRASGRLIEIQKTETQRLQAKVADLDTQSAVANKAIAEANQRAKQLELETEKLRNQNLKLQERMEWRTISQSERTKMIEALKHYAGHSVQLTFPNENAEASSYADTFEDMFIAAGWTVQQGFYSAAFATATKKYGVIFRSTPNSDAAVKSLLDVLKEINISIRTEQVGGDSSFVEIFIGPKPNR
jgi:hypothetical protein